MPSLNTLNLGKAEMPIPSQFNLLINRFNDYHNKQSELIIYNKLRYSLNVYEIQIYEILVIPQVERYASKYAFNKFTIEVFQAAMNAMAEKAEQPTGNKWVFI